MKIVADSPLASRIADAKDQDDVLIVVGDPLDRRALMTLSVDKTGRGYIECDEVDLVSAIRTLNSLINDGIASQRAA